MYICLPPGGNYCASYLPTAKTEVPGSKRDATAFCSRCSASRFRFCLTEFAANAAIPPIPATSKNYNVDNLDENKHEIVFSLVF